MEIDKSVTDELEKLDQGESSRPTGRNAAMVTAFSTFYEIRLAVWMGTRDNGLPATLYGPSSVTAKVGDGVPVKIIATTDYPFNETISMKMAPEKDVAFPLYLRIPGWCQNAQITVNDNMRLCGTDPFGQRLYLVPFFIGQIRRIIYRMRLHPFYL